MLPGVCGKQWPGGLEWCSYRRSHAYVVVNYSTCMHAPVLRALAGARVAPFRTAADGQGVDRSEMGPAWAAEARSPQSTSSPARCSMSTSLVSGHWGRGTTSAVGKRAITSAWSSREKDWP